MMIFSLKMKNDIIYDAFELLKSKTIDILIL